MLLGLTGGIGAGKSSALAAFARRGFPTLSSDDVVHGLYADPAVREAVVQRFGADVLAPSGEVDRAALARVVFADDAARRWLEALLHPLVAESLERFRAAHDHGELIVHEVPLLFEAALEDRYDLVVVVTAPVEIRRARSPARFDERAGYQLPEAEKAARADRVIVNDRDEQALDRAIGELVEDLRG